MTLAASNDLRALTLVPPSRKEDSKVVAGAESIILVPGLFGFSRIGNIDYFAAVANLLSKATGIEDVTPLPTPPTGPLWRRVDALHRCVREKVSQGAKRIHVIGHSTGGIDVRLLTNSRYMWPDGPWGDDRTSWFDHIGSVISISAPHRGTPIARRLRGSLEGAIPLLFLVSILAKIDGQNHGPWKSIRERLERGYLYVRLARSIKTRSATPSHEAVADWSSADNDVRAFLDQIVDDHPLIHELTPYAMARLNEKLAAGRDAGHELPVRCFVTVAPPPALRRADFRPAGGLAPARRALYVASYEAARLEAGTFGPLPEGRWIGQPERLEDFASVAQDGVVPAASQTLDGRAEALVYGDHLDVVGHFPGAKYGGETVFDSGADFDDARMEAVWTAVGAVVVNSRSRDCLSAA
jgi:triacylglycerol lipase